MNRNAMLFGFMLAFVARLAEHPVPPVPPKAVKPRQRVLTENECLASAIHYEARTEPLEGQRAVFEVIHHRAKSKKQSICKIISAKGQFSWYGLKPILPFNREMKDLVSKVRNHESIFKGEKFNWFYSGPAPKWANKLDCRVVGTQNFCKEKDEDF